MPPHQGAHFGIFFGKLIKRPFCIEKIVGNTGIYTLYHLCWKNEVTNSTVVIVWLKGVYLTLYVISRMSVLAKLENHIFQAIVEKGWLYS